MRVCERLILGLAAVTVLLAGTSTALSSPPVVRIGLYMNPPFTLLDSSGNPAGFIVDLLDSIAKQEGWKIAYRQCSWSACLNAVKKGDIDLLAPIAFSQDRTRNIGFSKESVLTNWGSVYAREPKKIYGFLDLKDKKIAVLRKDVYAEALTHLLKRFEISADFIAMASYDKVLAAVEDGSADAGVVNRIYGQGRQKRYHVIATPIVFHPIQIHFGAPKGDTRFLPAIDKHLRRWKRNSRSPYSYALAKWLQICQPSTRPSTGAKETAMVLGAMAILFLLLAFFLLRQSRIRNIQLKKSHRDLDRARHTVEEVENLYRIIFEKTNDGLGILDEKGVFVKVNPAFAELFGTKRDDLLGKTPMDFSPPMQLDGAPSEEKARVLIKKALAGEPQCFEWTHTRTDGFYFQAEVQLIQVFHEGENQLLATVRDITEHKDLAQKLEYKRQYLETVLDVSPVPSIVIDILGKVILWNKTCEELTGIQRSDVLGKPLDLSPLFQGRKLPVFATLLLEKTPREIVREFADRGVRLFPPHPEAIQANGVIYVKGKPVPLSIVAARLRNAKGELIGTMQCAQDISEEVRLQNQLAQSQKIEAVGRLAGGVAHDFNNILTVILGYCDLLLAQWNPEPAARRRVEEIRQAAERASTLTQQLLAFSRKQVMTLSSVHVNPVIEELQKMLLRLIGEDVKLELHLGRDLWPIRADRGPLEQIILNLAVNARDAMTNGGTLTITTRNRTLPGVEDHGIFAVPPGEYVEIQVSDTGCGMDETIMSQIFEPFFTTKPPGVGTGLGLSTVYGIVKQLRGYIHVQSAPGSGTIFTVLFPRNRTDQDINHQEKGDAKDQDVEVHGSETILVVEDEDIVRSMATEGLEAYGYRVIEAVSAQEALELCKESPRIDLVVTDVIMPEMDGPTLVAKIQEHRPGILVLYMSGYTDDRLKDRGVLRKETDFLPKPFTPSQLASKVREILDRDR